jgi:hypothetical protein
MTLTVINFRGPGQERNGSPPALMIVNALRQTVQ